MGKVKSKVKFWVWFIIIVLLIGTLLYVFLPPKQSNYTFRLNVKDRNEAGWLSANIDSDIKTIEVQVGSEVSVRGEIINESKKWQMTNFSNSELLIISINKGTETVFRRRVDGNLDGKYTFPWRKGYLCYSEYYINFTYTFKEAGTYTVVATSNFRQLWKDYSYESEALTVIVK